MLDSHCETELFTIKFHLQDHLRKGLRMLEKVRFLNASANEHFHKVYR